MILDKEDKVKILKYLENDKYFVKWARTPIYKKTPLTKGVFFVYIENYLFFINTRINILNIIIFFESLNKSSKFFSVLIRYF